MKAKYSSKEYEVFRRRCVELHQLGWKQEVIADAFGLTQGWVIGPPKRSYFNEV